MRFAVVLLLLASAAHADSLDVKSTVAKVKACANAEDLAALGAIDKAETIGKRAASAMVQLTGKKARGYVVFGSDGCSVIPVAGKPVAFVRGKFGGGSTLAYALRGGPSCGDVCASVVSLKSKDGKLLDLLVLPNDCEDGMKMAKRAVFAGRDSIE
ncbi:MAG: hypothetical protein H0T65_00445, partial [Deltaproteobacteria bacterium]|nr:hypothetical protein [Deltaproteobacteria bacterium]